LKFLPSGGALGVSAAFAASGFDSKLTDSCEEKVGVNLRLGLS